MKDLPISYVDIDMAYIVELIITYVKPIIT